MEHLRTACPLDCPDACTIDATVVDGVVTKLDGTWDNPLTQGFLCAKVRRFPRQVYGPERLTLPGAPRRRQGRGRVRPHRLGRSARSVDDAHPSSRERSGGEAHPAALLRRLERTLLAGRRRRPVVRAHRRVAPGAHGVRRRHRRGRDRALRQDARRRAGGLSRRRAHRAVGREPVGLRHPSGPDPRPGARARRSTGGGRSTAHAARRQGRSPSRGAARRRPSGRARHRPLAVRARQGRPRLPRSAHQRLGAPARAGRALDAGARRRAGGDRRRRHRATGGALRRGLARGDPVRLGARAQSQRRLRGGFGAGAARGGRQVRRPRRRLHAVELRRLEGARRASGQRDAGARRASST